jgi:hypothetical protein
MPEPCDRTRRAAPATSPVRVSPLLPWGANSSLPRKGRTHATTRPRAGGRSRGGVRGSGWTSPSLRTTRSLSSLSISGSALTHRRPWIRGRVRRRSIAANRHNCSGNVAVCRNGFTTVAHSTCPPDPILANDSLRIGCRNPLRQLKVLVDVTACVELSTCEVYWT